MINVVSTSEADSLSSKQWFVASWRPDVSVTLGFTNTNVGLPPWQTQVLPSERPDLELDSAAPPYEATTIIRVYGWRDRAARLRPQTRSMRAAAILKGWLKDRTGYDARVWPLVKQTIEDNRLSDRKRFGE